MTDFWEWHSSNGEMNCPLCRNNMLFTELWKKRGTTAIFATGPTIPLNYLPTCKSCSASRSGSDKTSVLDFMSKHTKVITEKQADKIREHLAQCFRYYADSIDNHDENEELFASHEDWCVVCRILKENDIAAQERREAEKAKEQARKKKAELERQQEIERQEIERQKELERQRELEIQRQTQRREAYKQAKLELYEEFHDKTVNIINDIAQKRKFLDEEYLFEKD